MYYHEDDYGGAWYDDTPENDEQEAHGDFDNEPDYYPDRVEGRSTRREWLYQTLFSRLHMLRTVFDKGYRDQVDDPPF
jgi:hypothetical protein